jgi:hypothetical protein
MGMIIFVMQKEEEILISATCFWSAGLHCHMLTHDINILGVTTGESHGFKRDSTIRQNVLHYSLLDML